MNDGTRKRRAWVTGVVLALAVLCGQASAGAEMTDPAGEERQSLILREHKLRERIDELRFEEDLLIKQKALLASDSKYVLLDLKKRKGTLKYRNRILRTFDFDTRKAGGKRMKPGIYTVSEKTDGSSKKRQLLFSNPPLVIARKPKTSVPTDKPGKGSPLVLLKTKDMDALFFVLEPGSQVLLLKQ